MSQPARLEGVVKLSRRVGSTELPETLSPSTPIANRSWQVLSTTSSVRTLLMYAIYITWWFYALRIHQSEMFFSMLYIYIYIYILQQYMVVTISLGGFVAE